MSGTDGDLKAKLRMREDEISGLRSEIENVKIMNSKLVDDQHEYGGELEALNRHMAHNCTSRFIVSNICVTFQTDQVVTNFSELPICKFSHLCGYISYNTL